MAALALTIAAGCESKKEAVMASGIDLGNLDTTVVRGADFFQYACGGWMKKHPLTDEYSRFGSFDMLAENNREQLKGLIAEIAGQENEKGTVAQKIADIYNLAMDSAKLNTEGIEPIKADLERIASVKDKEEIVPLMAELSHIGIRPYFTFFVDADIMTVRVIYSNYIREVSVWVRRNIIWIPMRLQQIFVINIRNIL